MAIFALAAGVTLGGCPNPPFPISRSPPNAACSDDPCAAMACPPGDRCVWDTNCRPRCEPQPLPTFGR